MSDPTRTGPDMLRLLHGDAVTRKGAWFHHALRDTKRIVPTVRREHGPNPWVPDTTLYALAELKRALRDLRRTYMRAIGLSRWAR